MKTLYIYVAALVLMLAPMVAQASVVVQSPTALTKGLTGYWTLDGKTVNWSTGAVGDSSGQGNGGWVQNLATTTAPTAGKVGQGMLFNGVNSYVSIPDTDTYTPSDDFTVSCWLKPATGGVNFFEGCIAKAGLTGNREWELGFDPSQSDAVRFLLGGSSGGWNVDMIRSTGLTRNVWHHIAATKLGNTITVYVDGVQSGVSATYSGGNVANTASPVYIGGVYQYETTSPFNGAIDEARYYNRALSATEIAQLYKSGGGTIGQSNTTTLSTGLIGYWPMDGKNINWSTGSTTDLSGQGNNGQLVAMSTTTSVVAGKIGQALTFNGFNTKIVMASTTLGDFGTSNFTVSGWFKTSTTTQGTLVAKRPICGHTSFWSVTTSAAGKLFFEVDEDAAGTNYKAFSSNKTVTDGVWHQFVFIRSGNTISAYIDGVFDNSGTAAGTANISNASAQTIGYSTGCGRGFNGVIDDVRTYNRALSATEAAQLYTNGGGTLGKSIQVAPSGLVGQWTFDGKTMDWANGLAKDSSGQGNNGQLVSMSTTTSPVAGKSGQALLFDGTNDKVLIADASSLNPSTVTISAWIYSTGADPSANSERIVDKANSGTITQNGYRMQAFSASGCGSASPEWGMQWYNGSAQLLCGPIIASTTNKWVHIVFTHDGTTGRIYANGVLVGSRVASYTGSNTFNLAIGNSDQVNKTFNGKIDDVRIYNRALTTTEVSHLYAAGK